MLSRSDNVNWRERSNTITTRSNRTCKKSFADKCSQGIACCRLNAGKLEILLIKKRFTYAFNKFVHGRYSSNNTSEIILLFGGMTIEEKLDLCSLNFSQMWYRVWLDSKIMLSSFFTYKNKFEKTFLVDGGIKLRKLLNKSGNSHRIWEIPKGHKKNKAEHDLHCAIREFYEETGINKCDYKLFADAKITSSYIDEGVRYINNYFIAFTPHVITPKIDFTLQEQINEISDIRWMNIESIRQIDYDKRLEQVVRDVFAYMRRALNQNYTSG